MKLNEILTNNQCDAFVLEHRYVAIGSDDNHPPAWHVWETSGTSDNFHSYGTTRQKAITDFWRRYYSDWQPPEPVHDAEWALKKIVEYDLAIGNTAVWDRVMSKRGVTMLRPLTDVSAIVEAIEIWIDKYATPEPTVMEMLESFRSSLLSDTKLLKSGWLKALDALIEREKANVNDGDK